jgi:hypothetical protein
MVDQWKKIKDEPPPPELLHQGFFVGHSQGGRVDYVFRWPGSNGEMAYWVKGSSTEPNRELTDYTPDVWYPGPPTIPGSWADRIQKGEID